MDWSNLPEGLKLGATVAQIFFYVVAAVVALKGLQSWRDKLQGESQYEAAADALVVTGRLRDALYRHLQKNFTIVDPKAMALAKDMGCSETLFDGAFASACLDPLLDDYRDTVLPILERLQEKAVVVEAILGKEEQKAVDEVITVANIPYDHADMYQKHLKGVFYLRDPEKEKQSAYNRVVCCYPLKVDFETKVDKRMNQLKELLLPYIRHNPKRGWLRRKKEKGRR